MEKGMKIVLLIITVIFVGFISLVTHVYTLDNEIKHKCSTYSNCEEKRCLYKEYEKGWWFDQQYFKEEYIDCLLIKHLEDESEVYLI